MMAHGMACTTRVGGKANTCISQPACTVLPPTCHLQCIAPPLTPTFCRCVNLEDQILQRIPDVLSSPADAAKALAVARYYLFGVGDVDSLLQVCRRRKRHGDSGA